MCLRRILRSTIDLPTPSRIGCLLGFWQEAQQGSNGSSGTSASTSNSTRSGVYTTPGRAMSSTNDTIKSFSTPSFGPVAPSHGTITDEELGNVSLQPLTSGDTVTHHDLHGPWVIVIPAELGLPSGELMLELDGHVNYRPGSELGGGVGTYEIQSASAGKPQSVLIRLECYVYAQKGSMPPSEAVTLTIHGLLQHAVITSHNQKILTLHGRAESHVDRKSTSGMVQAAKMDGWTPETQKVKPWIPNTSIQRDLAVLLPPLKTLTTQEEVNTSSYQRVDRTRHRVGADLLDSVYYVSDWIRPETEREILQRIQQTPEVAKSKLTKRLAQEWGCTMCEECNLSFVSDVNLPPWCQQVCDDMLVHDVFAASYYPNSVRVHEYGVGDGIAPHVDGPIYVPKVAILSLGAPCLFSFYPRREPYENPMEHYDDTFRFDGEIARHRPLCSVILEPRSLMIFERDAYWFHPHGVSDKPVDSLLEERCGPIINRSLVTTVPRDAVELPRAYRVGVTVRHLLPRCDHQLNRQEYFMKRSMRLKQAHQEVYGLKSVASSSPSPPAKRPGSSTSSSSSVSFPPIRGEGNEMKRRTEEEGRKTHTATPVVKKPSLDDHRTIRAGQVQAAQPKQSSSQEQQTPTSTPQQAQAKKVQPARHEVDSSQENSTSAPVINSPTNASFYPPPHQHPYLFPPMMMMPCYVPPPYAAGMGATSPYSPPSYPYPYPAHTVLPPSYAQPPPQGIQYPLQDQHRVDVTMRDAEKRQAVAVVESEERSAPSAALLQEVNEKLEATRRTLDSVVRAQSELQQSMQTLVVAIATAQEQSGTSLDAVSRAVVRMDSALHKLIKGSSAPSSHNY